MKTGINPDKHPQGLIKQTQQPAVRPDEQELRKGPISSLTVSGFLLTGIPLDETMAAGIVPTFRTVMGTVREKPCNKDSAAA